jgi:ATP/maltotriose-dependent transcriptional regulator MalT
LQPSIVVERLDSSLAFIQQNGDPTELAICQALFGLFLGGIAQRDFPRALQFARDSFSHFERIGDRFYLAVALHAFAWAYYYQGMRQQAVQYAHECAQLRREIGDHYGTARILLLVAAEAYSIPDYAKAERLNLEVRDNWRELRSWDRVSFVNVNLAYLAIFRGDFDAARALLDEALVLARGVGIRDQIAYALAISGVLASLEERYTQAWQLLSQAKEFARFTSSLEALEWGLPLAACGLHDYETARSANLRAFQFARRLNAPGRYFWHLPAACVLLAHEGYTERVAELLGFIFTHPASAPGWIARWDLFTRLRVNLEAALGTAAYQAAWKRGESFDLQAVVSETMDWLSGQPAEPSTSVNPILDDPLTPRELEVLRLLASGLTNPQIAERLVIGVGTVKTHTLNIYSKLGVSSRTQAILRAQELSLLV